MFDQVFDFSSPIARC